jgi:hypothetical protein
MPRNYSKNKILNGLAQLQRDMIEHQCIKCGRLFKGNYIRIKNIITIHYNHNHNMKYNPDEDVEIIYMKDCKEFTG